MRPLRAAVEDARQQIVDGDVAGDGLPRKPGDETHEPGARAVGKTELQLRHLHAARDNVDDTAEAARHHAVHGETHHFDGGKHHRVQGGDPIVPRPIVEVARQRAVGVVEQDIGLRTGGKRSRASRAAGNIGGNRADLDAGRRRDLRAGFFQRVASARDNGHVHALLRERERAGAPQAAARPGQKRLSSVNPQIHRHIPSWSSGLTEDLSCLEDFAQGDRLRHERVYAVFSAPCAAMSRSVTLRRRRSDRSCSRTACRDRAPARYGCPWRAPRRRGWSAACAGRPPAARAPSSATSPPPG